MAVDLYFFSNVTLGYGSPKYINFIKECANHEAIKNISTIEPMEDIRQKYQLAGVKCKRLTIGSALWNLPFLNLFLKSYRLDSYVVKPINALLLNLFILFVSIKTLFKPVAIVTTYDHALFGFFSKKAIICQNFSEIWQKSTDGISQNYLAKCKNFFINKYRKNVRFLIAPQEDRLDLAKKYYPNAETFLVHNAPSLSNDFNSVKNTANKVILYQGRVSRLSLADKLIAFAEALPAEIHLHIAGIVNDEYQARIAKLIEKDNVFFHGYLKWDDLASLRSQCNIGILAWSNDSLNTKYCAPNKLYEYMASGMYVICFDNFSLAKLQQEFSFGYVEKGSPTDLVNYVSELSNEDINLLGEKNHQLYLTTLNFEAQHKAFFNSYFIAARS